MIRAIAAVDDKLGISTDTGIPWSVPADVQHFREMTMSSNVLMGYGTYVEFTNPMPGRTNYVATGRSTPLRDGFVAVSDLTAFLSSEIDGDLWIIGGATLYATTLECVQEIELTRVAGDYGCTKFFPAFDTLFRLTAEEVPPVVQGIPAIRFQTWQRN
jgi:dihydrofolate reductase